MKQIAKVCLVCLCCAVLLCGCQLFSGQPEDESVAVDYSQMITDAVDIAIEDCITDQQISTVVGMPMTLLGVYEEGTQAVFMSEDATCQVNINLMNQPRSVFDSTVGGAENAVLQEGLGEAGYWFEETGELVVYAGGYSLGVAVVTVDPTNRITYAQQITTTILQKLQPAQ